MEVSLNITYRGDKLRSVREERGLVSKPARRACWLERANASRLRTGKERFQRRKAQNNSSDLHCFRM